MSAKGPRVSAILAAVVFAVACSHHTDLRKPAAQDDFGVQMAKINLWREAMFRFQRAIEINPADAMAHNNLAVAYEATGEFEKARKEYLEALKLDRSNQYIQKNYSRFVEFLSRNRKREPKEVKSADAVTPPASGAQPPASTVATPPATPPVTATSAEPPPAVAPPSDIPPQPATPPATPPPPQPKPPGGGR